MSTSAALPFPFGREYHAASLALHLATAAVLAVGFATTSLNPGHGDLQFFLLVGELWRDGQVPYRDVWDNKPPGIFATMALLSHTRENVYIAIALLQGLFQAGACALVWLTLRESGVRSLFAGAATLSCASILSAYSLSLGGGLTEAFLVFPASIALFCFARVLRGQQAAWLPLLAGLAAGVAASFKQVGAASGFAFGFVSLLALLRGQLSLAAVARALGLALAGFCLAWLPWIVLFACTGGLASMLEATFLLPALYAGGSEHSFVARLTGSFDGFRGLQVCLAFTMALAVLCLGWALRRATPADSPTSSDTGKRSVVLFAATLFLLDYLLAIAAGRNHPHYFQALAPSAGVVFGLGTSLVAERLAARPRWLQIVVTGTLLVAPIAGGALNALHDARLLTERQYARYFPYAQLQVADFLDTHANHQDTLFVWPFRPLIQRHAQLRNAGRILSNVNLDDSPYVRDRVNRQVEEMFLKNPPVYLVTEQPMTPSQNNAELLPFLLEQLRTKYARAYLCDSFEVYVLKSRATGNEQACPAPDRTRAHDTLEL